MDVPFALAPGLASIVRPGVLWWAAARVASHDALDGEVAAVTRRVVAAPPPETQAVREMYRRVGLDPTKRRPSSEALLRRVRRGDPFPRVNALVDAVNLCSLEWQLPYGVYDRRALSGAVTLRLGAEGEAYDGIRKDTVHVGGRLTVADDHGPVRQPHVGFGPGDGDGGHGGGAGGGLRAGIGAGGRGGSGARPHGRPRGGGGRRTRDPAVDRMTRRPSVSAILAAGGLGTRMGGGPPKQFRELGGRTLLERSLAALAGHPRVSEVVVALPAAHLDPPPACLAAVWPCAVVVVEGGERRRDSVARAFSRVSAGADVVLVHDAARPFVSAVLIDRMIDAVADGGAAVPAVRARDTVKRGVARDGDVWVEGTLPRGEIYLVQTPQAFGRGQLARAFALAGDDDATDEAGLVERAGGVVRIVDGEDTNVKITTADDLRAGITAPSGVLAMRIGTGYDLHRLVPGRRLVLAGVDVPFESGLDGHSDADIVCHAVTDAVLGAAALGDIGRLFPDTDAVWKDADSIELLRQAVARVHASGLRVGNVDVTVVAQRPKLLPYLEAMRARLAAALAVDVASVSIKGKTNEGVDSTGRGEAMACHAVALLVGAAGAPEPRAPGPEPRR